MPGIAEQVDKDLLELVRMNTQGRNGFRKRDVGDDAVFEKLMLKKGVAT